MKVNMVSPLGPLIIVRYLKPSTGQPPYRTVMASGAPGSSPCSLYVYVYAARTRGAYTQLDLFYGGGLWEVWLTGRPTVI